MAIHVCRDREGSLCTAVSYHIIVSNLRKRVCHFLSPVASVLVGYMYGSIPRNVNSNFNLRCTLYSRRQLSALPRKCLQSICT